ncbi:hypothetical protein DSECCO2_627800 [anaerobic digester metagenome]
MVAGRRPYPREKEVLQVVWILVGVGSKPVLIPRPWPHFPHEGEHAHCRVVRVTAAIRHTAGGALEVGLECGVDALKPPRELSDIVNGEEERDKGADVLVPEGNRSGNLLKHTGISPDQLVADRCDVQAVIDERMPYKAVLSVVLPPVAVDALGSGRVHKVFVS